MGVTWVSEAGWGAKPAEVLLEGLELTAEGMERLVEGGALGPVLGGQLWDEGAAESTYMGLGDSILGVIGAPEKAKLASTMAVPTGPAVPEALACKEPPPSPPTHIQRETPISFTTQGTKPLQERQEQAS